MVIEWRNSGMAAWWNGGMAEWIIIRVHDVNQMMFCSSYCDLIREKNGKITEYRAFGTE
jgi:hypothetical protein